MFALSFFLVAACFLFLLVVKAVGFSLPPARCLPGSLFGDKVT